MTNDMFTLPDDDELERLGDFLLERIDEDAVTEGMDEGVLDVSELDGLFTAIVSGPVMIPPSQWLPAVWGDFEPVWDSAGELEEIFSLMMRQMNGIASLLMDQPQDFEPLFLERRGKDRVSTIVDEWCEGYMRGVALAADAWSAAGPEMQVLLAPIRAFTSETKWRAHDLDSEAEFEAVRDAIILSVQEIHAYWLARRAPTGSSAAPFRHTEPRVGRNDPCPCGSGKKYKKCCLH